MIQLRKSYCILLFSVLLISMGGLLFHEGKGKNLGFGAGGGRERGKAAARRYYMKE